MTYVAEAKATGIQRKQPKGDNGWWLVDMCPHDRPPCTLRPGHHTASAIETFMVLQHQ